MPFHEFKCPGGHLTEKFFKSFSSAEGVESVDCTVCSQAAKRIVSAPLGFGFYGDPGGYYKPSSLKRFTTKTVTRKYGNDNA